MQSEIARLKQQIEEEYEAAQQGLNGLAEGSARHRFITQRLVNMGLYCQQLEALAGM
jgi:hypothetical protein